MVDDERPRRVQLSRKKGWRMPANTVSVARPLLLGNPFVVGEDGTREQCVFLYRHLLDGRVCLTSKVSVARQLEHRAAVMRDLPRLRGSNLACWCRDDGKPCHADVLLELANADRILKEQAR
ncbi:DUF4326 domain-containing protein [Sphingomonas sp.]|uniref:DUF4326 domain-containing protein n=1 Tax=Sphingomonas sp. TaxID=28214 RepID=UPI0035C79655